MQIAFFRVDDGVPGEFHCGGNGEPRHCRVRCQRAAVQFQRAVAADRRPALSAGQRQRSRDRQRFVARDGNNAVVERQRIARRDRAVRRESQGAARRACALARERNVARERAVFRDVNRRAGCRRQRAPVGEIQFASDIDGAADGCRVARCRGRRKSQRSRFFDRDALRESRSVGERVFERSRGNRRAARVRIRLRQFQRSRAGLYERGFRRSDVIGFALRSRRFSDGFRNQAGKRNRFALGDIKRCRAVVQRKIRCRGPAGFAGGAEDNVLQLNRSRVRNADAFVVPGNRDVQISEKIFRTAPDRQRTERQRSRRFGFARSRAGDDAAAREPVAGRKTHFPGNRQRRALADAEPDFRRIQATIDKPPCRGESFDGHRRIVADRQFAGVVERNPAVDRDFCAVGNRDYPVVLRLRPIAAAAHDVARDIQRAAERQRSRRGRGQISADGAVRRGERCRRSRERNRARDVHGVARDFELAGIKRQPGERVFRRADVAGENQLAAVFHRQRSRAGNVAGNCCAVVPAVNADRAVFGDVDIVRKCPRIVEEIQRRTAFQLQGNIARAEIARRDGRCRALDIVICADGEIECVQHHRSREVRIVAQIQRREIFVRERERRAERERSRAGKRDFQFRNIDRAPRRADAFRRAALCGNGRALGDFHDREFFLAARVALECHRARLHVQRSRERRAITRQRELRIHRVNQRSRAGNHIRHRKVGQRADSLRPLHVQRGVCTD